MPRFHQSQLNPYSLLNSYIDNQSIQLIGILGVGAYGIIYLGQNTVTSQQVAIKLLTHLSRREAEIHAYLSRHPNILSFEKLVYEDHKMFMILEYRPEGDLFSAITKNRKGIVGNNDSIRHIFLQIIDGVQFCHQHQIAHRDLKPENIMLGPELSIKLTDFGLATTQSISTEFGCGSTFYFSPECQGNNRNGYDTQKNDIWSLGVILINLTAGRNPWKQATLNNPAYAAYLRHPGQFFKTILPCISSELESILLDIFCLDPDQRITLAKLRLRIEQCTRFVQPISRPIDRYHPYSHPYKSLKVVNHENCFLKPSLP
ncbi:Negative regulator of sexual conjugation and meiosis [Choanephora cucurbitarum]|uniref:Negative regulator of sexual conjugation and meiosis n=1 Tax=Choanephora cucurbitarum TaxID=101091 RepID=A0A1C7MYU9_9FUNG|nr:Negative regulator of sexual conjugation and meiosis [Choanephora cucurbitarum]